MLGILWLVLKIILIFIGIVLGIALLLLAFVLFDFCRFEAKGEKENDDIVFKAEFRWLLGLIKGCYEISGEHIKYNVNMPFGLCKIKYDSEEEELEFDVEEKNICNESKNINKTIANIQKNGNIYNIMVKFKSFFTAVKSFIKGLFEKAVFVKNFNDKYCVEKLLKATFKLLKKLIKNMGFKKFEVKGTVGFDDPSDTGKVLGAVYSVIPFLPFDVSIDGNFDNRELKGNFYIKGRTNLWLLLFPVVRYVLTKPVWPLVRDYWKGELNEQL